MPLLQLESVSVFSAEMMVTSYQKQYFYTETMDQAKDFVRDIADTVNRPFTVRLDKIAHYWLLLYFVFI